MENSMNESATQQSFRSPPRRRRSTFFERRDSIVAIETSGYWSAEELREKSEDYRAGSYLVQRLSMTIQIVPQTNSENVNPNTKDTNINERPTEDISRYYQKLLIEKEMWKKEVNERRNKYHDLRQQYQIAAKSSSRSRISYSALSNEDIEFLKAKPNLSKLVDSQQKLHKCVSETRELFRRANELDDVVLTNSEDIVASVTNYILENSTVEQLE